MSTITNGEGLVMTHMSGIQRWCAWSALLAVFFLAAIVRADSWSLPTPQSYLSIDKTWRFTVTPRALSGQLAYFEDKVAHHKLAGAIPGNLQKQAQGFMEHLEQGQWRAVWNTSLVNDVAPVSAIISPSGQAVTFDNWGSMGYGNDAVVLYTAQGKPLRMMGLKDFLPAEYIEALPSSVSSLWWGGGHHFSADGRQLVLRVVIPFIRGPGRSAIADEDAPHLVMRFDLATGRLIPVEEKAWSSAMAAARAVNAANHEADMIARARFIAPLTSPHSDAEGDWYGYLVEAFFRLDPDWKDGYPATMILRLPQQSDYQASVGFLRDALHDERSGDGALMIASPSQDNLVRVLTELGSGVRRDELKHARVYVVLDAAHNIAVAKALERSGAKFIPLDPNRPIPQRKERLDAYMAQK